MIDYEQLYAELDRATYDMQVTLLKLKHDQQYNFAGAAAFEAEYHAHVAALERVAAKLKAVELKPVAR